MEEAEGAPTKFVAGASRCFLFGVNWYGDLHGMIAMAGVGGLARRRTSRRIPPMIDWLIITLMNNSE